MSTILVILIGLGIIVLCGMAIKYSESAVSLLILLPGVQVSERNGNVAMATIQKRQALRLKESLDDQLLALKNSEM